MPVGIFTLLTVTVYISIAKFTTIDPIFPNLLYRYNYDNGSS